MLEAWINHEARVNRAVAQGAGFCLGGFLNGKAIPLAVRGKMQMGYVGELQTFVSAMFMLCFINSTFRPGTGLYLLWFKRNSIIVVLFMLGKLKVTLWYVM